jgi:hypothetical protein
MAKRTKKTVSKDTLTGRFTLGRSFTKISLVEGIRLSDPMEKRATEAARKHVSPEEYRKTIVQSHRKG